MISVRTFALQITIEYRPKFPPAGRRWRRRARREQERDAAVLERGHPGAVLHQRQRAASLGQESAEESLGMLLQPGTGEQDQAKPQGSPPSPPSTRLFSDSPFVDPKNIGTESQLFGRYRQSKI